MVTEVNKVIALGLEPLLKAEGFKRVKRGRSIEGFPARTMVAHPLERAARK